MGLVDHAGRLAWFDGTGWKPLSISSTSETLVESGPLPPGTHAPPLAAEQSAGFRIR